MLMHASARTRDWVKMGEESFKGNGQPVRFFKTFMYQAGSWKYAQRVIVKIEVNEKGTNVRYIVTNFKRVLLSHFAVITL